MNHRRPVETNPTPPVGERPWKEVVRCFQQPADWRAIWQILNTLVPYAALWYCKYRPLEKCHHSEPLFQTVKPVTLLSSLKCFRFRLWDERTRRMVGYASALGRGP